MCACGFVCALLFVPRCVRFCVYVYVSDSNCRQISRHMLPWLLWLLPARRSASFTFLKARWRQIDPTYEFRMCLNDPDLTFFLTLTSPLPHPYLTLISQACARAWGHIPSTHASSQGCSLQIMIAIMTKFARWHVCNEHRLLSHLDNEGTLQVSVRTAS